jgi:hypothetical protein
MATAISKNARKGETTQKLVCRCGGTIKMVTIASGGKLRHVARCINCNREARRPKDLFV